LITDALSCSWKSDFW